MNSLGIDPGSRSGAAVLLDPSCKFLAAWCWKQNTWGYRVDEWDGDNHSLDQAKTLGGVGATIAAKMADGANRPFILAVEGLFFARNKGTIRLVESAAEVYGPIQEYAANCGAILRPRSLEWRKEILGISERKLKAKASEQVAIRQMPARIPTLPTTELSPHGYEAAAIALWGLLKGVCGEKK